MSSIDTLLEYFYFQGTVVSSLMKKLKKYIKHFWMFSLIRNLVIKKCDAVCEEMWSLPATVSLDEWYNF